MKNLFTDLFRERNQNLKKITLMLAIIFIGIVSAVCLHFCSRREGRLTEGAQLIRNEWGAGDYSVTLQAESAGWVREIPLQISERSLTDEEKEAMFQDIERRLPELIKGENQDLQHVESDLVLINGMTEYPVKMIWDSSSERIDGTGKVTREGLPDAGEWAELTAIVSYQQERKYINYQVYLLPEVLGEEEIFFRDLQEEVVQIEAEENDQFSILLPQNLNGQEIIWKEVKTDNSIWLVVFAVLVSLLAGKSMDQKNAEQEKEKKRELLMEYPDFVSRLRLYLSAGMTTQRAFFKMAEDYKRKSAKKPGGLFEELKIACNQFQNGIPEERVYEEWGRRCGEMKYKRLSLLLITHLKQGNGQLLKVLAAEEETAREDRMQQARKLGEEAGTKLLFPMMLQLILVMFLILIPAYLDLGAI